MPTTYSSGAGSSLPLGILKTEWRRAKIVLPLPAQVNALNTSPATLKIVARGKKPLTYEWYRQAAGQSSEVLISGANTDTLNTSYGAGRYRVRVYNIYGEDESTTTVNIATGAPTEPPLIITQPEDQVIQKGGTATFTLVAAGGSPLTYQWKKGSQIVGTNANSLSVSSTDPDYYANNNTIYTCTVSNAYGSVTSITVKLTILCSPPIVTSSPSNSDMYVTTSTTLTLAATGDPAPIFEWFLPNNQGTVKSESLSFTADSSIYPLGKNIINWRVSNACGAIAGAVEINIKAIVPPSIILSFPRSVSFEADPDVPFTPTLDGIIPSEPPSRFESQNQNNGQTYPPVVGSYPKVPIGPVGGRGGSSNLPEPTDTSSSGGYTPTPISIDYTQTFIYIITPGWNPADNIPGSYPLPPFPPTTVVVEIKKPILLGQPPAITTAPYGTTVCFNAYAQSNTELTYTWYRNGSVVSSGINNYSFCEDVKSMAQYGDQYECVISNVAGFVRTRISTLQVLSQAPLITVSPTVKRLTDADMDGVCIKNTFYTANVLNAADPREREFSWYINGDLAQNWSASPYFAFGGCNCNDSSLTYVIEVFARYKNETAANSATASAILNITPVIIEQPQASLTVNAGDPVTLSVGVCRGNSFTYQWWRYRVIENDLIKINGATQSSYSFNASTADNDYQYFCTIKSIDETKSVDSDSTSLIVLGYD